jgi:uncharacterized protein
MQGIAFEWDRRKDSTNRRKHGVGVQESSTVFGDPLSITIPDPDHDIDEEGCVIIGMSSKRNLLIAVHTIRGERIRLINARPATNHERRNDQENAL